MQKDFPYIYTAIMAVKTQELTEVFSATESDLPCSLIVWNDDFNTFDWVIETLMEICEHTREQAEQCAWFIHTKGKYAVKNGAVEILQLMCEKIVSRGIDATVETVAV
jgi:ATP-dependent Clp protease adaptor protein ClpS